MGVIANEIRTDFTGSASDLERAANDAAESLGDVQGALDDVATEASLTDRQFEKLADELQTMLRRAERAEGKIRDLRGELRRVKKAADALDGTDIDLDVDVEVHEDIDRSWLRRLKDRFRKDGDEAGSALSHAITSALAVGMEDGIATTIGPLIASIGGPGLVAIAAAAGGVLAVGMVTGFGLAAGGALAIVSKWLYDADPNTPMAAALREVWAQVQHVADVLRSVLQPVFDEIAQKVLPIVIDKLMDLSEWLRNNSDTVQDWAMDMAKAFFSALSIATYFGQAITVVTGAVGAFVVALGAFVVGLGYAYKAMAIVIPGLGDLGDALVQGGKDAISMGSDIVEGSAAGFQALGEVRDASNQARAALDGATSKKWVFDVSMTATGWQAARAAADLRGVRLSGSSGGSSGKSSKSSAAPVLSPTINVQVDGGDPYRVTQAINRAAGIYGGGATVLAA